MALFETTIDSIISSFGKITAQLEKFIEAEDAKQLRFQDNIERAEKERQDNIGAINHSVSEVHRARRISEKIAALTE